MLNHLEAEKLFKPYGIVLEGIERASLDEAKKEIARGGVFFLKLVSSHEEATHKTEFGYVRKATNADELAEAWKSMEETAAKHGHGDVRFILQEARSGHEVMIGAKRDPIFGFQLIFTPVGGKYAEIHAKAVPPSVRVSDIDLSEAKAMITEHPLSAQIMGARGEAPADIDSLAKLLVSICKLMQEHPEVQALDLNPVFVRPDGISMVDARVETGEPTPLPGIETNRSLMVFIKPKKALLVIVNAKPNSVGAKLLGNLLNSVGDVTVMLTTGKGKEYLDEIGVPMVDDVPEGCDLLVYAALPNDAPKIVAKFRERGGEGAVIISSDFAETGNKDLENELHEAAGKMPYLGPNCLGVYSADHNTFFIDERRTTYPATGGGFAFFTQSGSLAAESFVEYLSMHGVPVAAIFSMGNVSGITITEIINRVADEPTVDCLVLHLEGGLKEGEGPHFVEALKRATKIKPILVLAAGLSEKGRQSAASHTGRMTGGAEALRAALKQGGAMVANGEEQLRLAVWMLHTMPRATGKAVVLTGGGGKGVLATDAAERVGLELRENLPAEFCEAVKPALPPFVNPSKNPFDFTASVILDGFIETLKASKMLGSPGIFYYGYHVPGATVTVRDGKPIGVSPLEAIKTVADTIKNCDLPFVLHIIGATGLSKKVEKKAEESGIVVTRTSSADTVLCALKLAVDTWKKYPDVDLRKTKFTPVRDTSLDCLEDWK